MDLLELELAKRCEASDKPDRELDAAIYEAVFRMPIHRSEGGQNLLTGQWYSKGETYAKKYTGSLDAAMTLVPEGWTFANLCQGDNKGWWCELRRGHLTSYDKVAIGQQLDNASPALAVCAAVLRAYLSLGIGDRS